MAETSNLRNLDSQRAERRAQGAMIREFGSHARDALGAARSETPFLSPTGWLIAVLLNIALVVLIGLSVVLVPPVMACREQSLRGFFAGDSFQACAKRGVADGLRDLEGRVRRVILRSGQ